VKNPNCLPHTREQLGGRVNTPSSIDVTFSNGAFTVPGGHPIEFQERNREGGIWTEADAEGAFYYTVDNEADLDRNHDGGLKVSVHIESATDFHALGAGVDEINYMPGFRKYADLRPQQFGDFGVGRTDAELAAHRVTYVITTLINALESDQRRQQDALNARNLRLLKARCASCYGQRFLPGRFGGGSFESRVIACAR